MGRAVSAREYVVGLPVVITVDDAGTVTVTVDMSEATGKGGMADHWSDAADGDMPACDWSENRMLLDCAIVDAERPTPAAVRLPANYILSMRCPVTYACGVTKTTVSAMADHIATHEGNQP